MMRKRPGNTIQGQGVVGDQGLTMASLALMHSRWASLGHRTRCGGLAVGTLTSLGMSSKSLGSTRGDSESQAQVSLRMLMEA